MYAALQERFDLEPRGEIAVKGKGVMQTWFLTGRSEMMTSMTKN
jgi:hypothetical protein